EISGTAWRKKELKLSENETSKADSKIQPSFFTQLPHTQTHDLSYADTLSLSHSPSLSQSESNCSKEFNSAGSIHRYHFLLFIVVVEGI
ncbi:unnamed protein product, partial [Sphagnum troendelagicum]